LEKSETYSFTITLLLLTLFLEIRKFLLFIKTMTQFCFGYLVHLQSTLVLIKQQNEKHPQKMAEANSCESCGFLEVKTFDMTKLEFEVIPDDQVAEGATEMRRLGRKLAKKKGLTKRDKKLRKIMKELIILLGHGQQVNSIPEAVAALLERNYPDLVKWNGDKKLVIFIPDFYLNKAVNYVDQNRADEVLQNLEEAAELHPERKEEFMKHRNALIGAKRVHRGEVPEVNMYNALTERFDKGDETVTIFHGLNITKFDVERQDNNVNEKDFVLLR
jgi:hypothetical protein